MTQQEAAQIWRRGVYSDWPTKKEDHTGVWYLWLFCFDNETFLKNMKQTISKFFNILSDLTKFIEI